MTALPFAMRKEYSDLMKRVVPKVPMLLILVQYAENFMEGPPFSVDLEEVREHYQELYKIEFLEKKSISDNEFTLDVFESAYMLK